MCVPLVECKDPQVPAIEVVLCTKSENCLHISYEAGKLEDPAVSGIPIIDFGMTISPQEAPDEGEEVNPLKEAPVGRRYFRKAFELAEAPSKAALSKMWTHNRTGIRATSSGATW